MASGLHIDPDRTLAQLATLAARLYAASDNFTVLHLVTSAHAMRVLLPWLDEGDVTEALGHYWLAYAAGHAASGIADSAAAQARRRARRDHGPRSSRGPSPATTTMPSSSSTAAASRSASTAARYGAKPRRVRWLGTHRAGETRVGFRKPCDHRHQAAAAVRLVQRQLRGQLEPGTVRCQAGPTASRLTPRNLRGRRREIMVAHREVGHEP